MISKNIQRAMLKANHVGAESKGFPYLAECLRQEGIVKKYMASSFWRQFLFFGNGLTRKPRKPFNRACWALPRF